MAQGLARFDFDELARLGLPVQRHRAGTRIFAAGEESLLMYVVLSGQVEVVAYGVVLDRVKRGGIFGEMALIDGEPRSATATVVADAEIVEVDRELFLRLVKGMPEFALAMMAELAQRIRRMNENL